MAVTGTTAPAVAAGVPTTPANSSRSGLFLSWLVDLLIVILGVSTALTEVQRTQILIRSSTRAAAVHLYLDCNTHHSCVDLGSSNAD